MAYIVIALFPRRFFNQLNDSAIDDTIFLDLLLDERGLVQCDMRIQCYLPEEKRTLIIEAVIKSLREKICNFQEKLAHYSISIEENREVLQKYLFLAHLLRKDIHQKTPSNQRWLIEEIRFYLEVSQKIVFNLALQSKDELFQIKIFIENTLFNLNSISPPEQAPLLHAACMMSKILLAENTDQRTSKAEHRPIG